MGTDACSDSFAFFSSSPLVVQQHPAHRLLIVIPVRRECCSWRCSSSARVTYFTAPTSTTIKPARAGVDFVEARGAVLFEVGQQRAQLAVEVLPALADDWKESEDSTSSRSQRAFAVVLEAPANTSTLLRASTEIIVEPTSTSVPAAVPTSASYTVVGILAAAGLAVLLVCWFRAWRCRLPHRSRAFQYKVLLLPRRNSGASEDIRDTSVSPRGSPVKKSSIRRSARRVSSFKNWRAVLERQRQEAPDQVVPEDEVEKEAVDEQDKDKGSSEDAEDESEPERDLREHLASIQSAGGR